MGDLCRETQGQLGWGEDPAQHLSKCSECSSLAEGYRRLDSLMASEPAPLAPLGLLTEVLARVALRRREELRLARLQALVPLAAALLLALAYAWGLPLPDGSGSYLPDTATAWGSVIGTWDLVLGELEGFLIALTETPSPPLVLLLVVAPALCALNWSLARGQQRRTT